MSAKASNIILTVRKTSYLMPLLLAIAVTDASAGLPEVSVDELYRTHCAECHGTDRLGGTGPALLPENLRRLRPKKALKTIAEGRAATQMPPFNTRLSTDQIQALVDYVYTPLKHIPEWGMQQIAASRIEHHAHGSLPDKPLYEADIDNLFVVVELGDHHATLLNGDTFTPIHRFQT
ncbi:MAG: c-type cytochrome, partial [Candidatus Thiodiazotropha lotti]